MQFLAWLTIIIVGLATSFFGFSVSQWLSDSSVWVEPRPKQDEIAMSSAQHDHDLDNSSVETDATLSEHAADVAAARQQRLHGTRVERPTAETVKSTSPGADWAVASVAVAGMVAIILVSVFFTTASDYPLALAFAPVGTFLRWRIGLWLNRPTFPFGTLAVNVVGCGIEMGLTMVAYTVALDKTECVVVQALITGFCGSCALLCRPDSDL